MLALVFRFIHLHRKQSLVKDNRTTTMTKKANPTGRTRNPRVSYACVRLGTSTLPSPQTDCKLVSQMMR